MIFKTKAQAARVIGGLSKVTAMPCPSFSISAFDCQTGSELAKLPGSVCHKCYARRGFYHWPTVKAAHQKRLELINLAIANRFAGDCWVAAFARCLEGVKWFRWHDSGDLQSVAHFDLIVRVCWETPGTLHWLPTKEPRYVKRWIDFHGSTPENLTVRVSAPMIDRMPDHMPFPTATVHTTQAPEGSVVCPVPTERKSCGDCRGCWNASIKNISYPETW